MTSRKVFMVGQSGAGKSSIGNLLLNNRNAFKPAPIGSPESMTTEISSSTSWCGDLQLTVFDTQGLGDTQGRSIEFLNDIITRIKNEKPHCIIFFIPGSAKFGPEVMLALTCLAQCLKSSVNSGIGLADGRTLMVVNKMPADAEYNSPFNQDATVDVSRSLAELLDKGNTLLQETLELPGKVCAPHTFGIQTNSPRLPDTITAIRTAIQMMPDEPMDVSQFRTHDQVVQEAQALERNAISADDNAAATIAGLEGEIQWHRNRIHDCSIAMAATSWIPFVNIGTTTGFAVAIEDSRAKIPGLQKDLANAERNKAQHLETARRKAIAWLKKINDLKTAMAMHPR